MVYGELLAMVETNNLSCAAKILSLQPSAFSLKPSAFSLQPSAFSLQPSAFSLQPSAFSLQPSAFSLLPSADCRLLFGLPPAPSIRGGGCCFCPLSIANCLLPSAFCLLFNIN